MDIVKQKRIREWTLLSLVGAMALVANLPPQLLDNIGIRIGLVMAVLGLLVVLALFLYVRFFFFLLYSLLAVGANLPEQWAAGLGVSQGPLLATLVVMVTLSLLNYSIKLLPSGLDPKKPKPNPEATHVLLNAIERNNLPYIKTVLSMAFDLDVAGDKGLTPLMQAAEQGLPNVVDMILAHGATASLAGPQGRASELALRNGHQAVAERLKAAEEAEAARAAKARSESTGNSDTALVD